ncbi:MAG: radical SAM protein [Spirochaetes bacterium]|nr:radical SAM protein [Spirochaetota bacterium]
MKHVFGPVPSRRLGRSLGVDLVPFKTCTYDCIYCQLGRTTDKTMTRREWFPLDDIVAEVHEALSTKPDYITLSGSGEPTLYSRAGELIDRIRTMTDIPVAVLTNGSLLWDPEVRRQIAAAHLAIPSIDAGDEMMFRRINRPHPDITFDRMVQGIIDFSREFPGRLWLEVFILGGYTTVAAESAKIAGLVKTIVPERVQLNTVTRPPAEDYAMAAPEERLHEIARCFPPPAEVIADFPHDVHHEDFTATRDSVLRTVRRRPCTVDDIARGLGIHRNEALKHLESLLGSNAIEEQVSGGKVFFRPAQGQSDGRRRGQGD